MKKNKAARKRNSRAPKEKMISSDRKAVIKNADMTEEMQQDAVDIATKALDKGDKVTKRKLVNAELDKMTKINLDNVELDDIASSSNDQKIYYNKNYIEKILYLATNKNIKVFLGYPNEPKQYTLHYSATDELIEQAKKLYVSNQSNDTHYYLVLNLNKKGLADGAYLAYFRYSKKHTYWKCNIEPLIDYRTICTFVVEFLRNTLEDMEVNIYRAQKHYDLSITIGSIEQVIEYTKLRIKYQILNKDNLEQYKSEFNNIKYNIWHVASSSNNEKLGYFKNYMEKTLYLATKKNIEVVLSYSNEPKQDISHYSATYEFIEQVNMVCFSSDDTFYYLVVNLNIKYLVDAAYLAYLCFSKQYNCWLCRIEPLINYKAIDINLVEFLSESCEDKVVMMWRAPMYYKDLTMTTGSIEQVIEITKQRILLFFK